MSILPENNGKINDKEGDSHSKKKFKTYSLFFCESHDDSREKKKKPTTMTEKKKWNTT